MRIFLFAAALALSLSSCAKNEPEAEIAEEAAPPSEEPELPEEVWKGSKSPLLVLAGQNFPEESGIASLLLREYGLGDEKPAVRFLYWPRTFEEEDASLRLFSNVAREDEPKIVIALAGPEGTTRELNRIRSEFPEIKIVSIFPSDDAIQTEAVSDMVIDMDISHIEASGIGEEIAEEEETALDITAEEAAVLLLGAALSMEESGEATGESATVESRQLEGAMRFAVEAAMQADPAFAAPRWEYVQATDPDTGLRSRRHVLIRQAR